MFTKINFPILCQPTRVVVWGDVRPASSMGCHPNRLAGRPITQSEFLGGGRISPPPLFDTATSFCDRE
jgi:hypothetical protein